MSAKASVVLQTRHQKDDESLFACPVGKRAAVVEPYVPLLLEAIYAISGH